MTDNSWAAWLGNRPNLLLALVIVSSKAVTVSAIIEMLHRIQPVSKFRKGNCGRQDYRNVNSRSLQAQ